MKGAKWAGSILLPCLATFGADAAAQIPSAPSPRPFGAASGPVFLQGRARAFRMLVGSQLCSTSAFRTEFDALTERLETATRRLAARFPKALFGLVRDAHNQILPPERCDDEGLAGLMPAYRAIIGEVEAVAADAGEDN